MQTLVDDFGQPILFGEQKDVGEFNLNFLERIEEGLGERLIGKNIKLEESKSTEEDDQSMEMVTPSGEDMFDMQSLAIRKSSIIGDGMETP